MASSTVLLCRSHSAQSRYVFQNELDFFHALRNDTNFEFFSILSAFKNCFYFIKKETFILFVLFNVIFIFLGMISDKFLESNRHLTLKIVSIISDYFIRLN
jgi:hypothetical protein